MQSQQAPVNTSLPIALRVLATLLLMVSSSFGGLYILWVVIYAGIADSSDPKIGPTPIYNWSGAEIVLAIVTLGTLISISLIMYASKIEKHNRNNIVSDTIEKAHRD